ncbi:hypothetical protein BJ878DRAFT_538563 [Calycina marina]|uniref:Uncharacterized protein n=1 Tax=Calycina marina TaxID=1763456 RepID=A0A9P8CIV4_9HELO|nr:hypothetical protein BJ878DRAFT_538563 [Calycina marina]
MSDWEQPIFPPETSSRWPKPAIHLNVEFGIAMRPEDKIRIASMNYTSKQMEKRLDERVRQQHEDDLFLPQQQQEQYPSRHPTILMPARGNRERQNLLNDQQDAVERQGRLGISRGEQHQRGTYAPPTIIDRTQPRSPISPVSPIIISPPQHTSSIPLDLQLALSWSDEMTLQRSAPTSSIWGPERSEPRDENHCTRPNWDRVNQKFPPSPSQFRLGDDALPWSVPPWYRGPEPGFASPPAATPAVPNFESSPNKKLDDPQRARDMETLHQAMMTVGTLSDEGWDDPSWQGFGAMPSGPRSLGWATSTEDASLFARDSHPQGHSAHL